MKIRFALIGPALVLCLCGAARGAEVATATITVDASRELSKVNPLIYGQFIEHLGMCIKDGLWTPEYEDHKLVLGGVREELYELIKKLNIPLLRWPGGCFSDGYHWQDGIGPPENRPERKNLAWARDAEETPQGPRENNAFGTDEFLRLCEQLRIEPLINVNLGSGTAEEARQWVEYVNGATDTEFGRLRAQNGHPEPYGVTYWGIGNESWGDYEIGYQKTKTGDAYGKLYLEFARAMKSADPHIRLLGVGVNPAHSEWNRKVLETAGAEIDYLSLHVYFPGFTMLPTWKNKKVEYYGIMAAGRELDEIMDNFDAQIQEYAPPGHDIPLALDEWNLWWNEEQIVRGEGYEFSAALFTADVLMRLLRRGDRVGFANLAQLVNVIPLIITDREKGIFVTPGYYVFDLFRNHISGDVLVSVETDSPTFSNKDYGIVRPRRDNPLIEAVAFKNAGNGLLQIMVMNKHYSKDVPVSIRLQGTGNLSGMGVSILTADSPHDANSFEEPKKLEGFLDIPAEFIAKPEFDWRLRPHSITLFTIGMEK